MRRQKNDPQAPEPAARERVLDLGDLEALPQDTAITYYLYRVKSEQEMMQSPGKTRESYTKKFQGVFDLELIRKTCGGGVYLLRAKNPNGNGSAGRLSEGASYETGIFEIDGPPRAAADPEEQPTAEATVLERILDRLEAIETRPQGGDFEMFLRAIEAAKGLQAPAQPAVVMSELLSVLKQGIEIGSQQNRAETNLLDVVRDLAPIATAFVQSRQPAAALPTPAAPPPPAPPPPAPPAPVRNPAEERDRFLTEKVAGWIRNDVAIERAAESADDLLTDDEFRALAAASPAAIARHIIESYPDVSNRAEHYLGRLLAQLRAMIAEEDMEPGGEPGPEPSAN